MKKNTNNKKSKVYVCLIALETLLTVLVSTFSVLLCRAVVWMFDTWQHLKIQELIYQLNAPAEGTNTDIITSFIKECIPPTVITLIIVLVVLIGLRNKKSWYHTVAAVCFAVSVAFLGSYLHMTWDRLEIKAYLENQTSTSSFIDDNYVDAKNVQITFPQEKRNLIYIYLESMETTYADIESGGAFENGCIDELTEIAMENEDFSGSTSAINGGYSLPGTTWTMGGIFAHTAALPLTLPMSNNNMDTQESFFPSIITLGDILEEAGYNQTFFIGSNATFGGRELYFTDHGNYEMKDLLYAKEMGRLPEEYFVWWGYEDKYLFEWAKEEILEMAQQEEPFNFTMLTVDTHYEDGFVCTDCENTYGNDQYANVMSCSSKKVKDFVEWAQQQEFYENTTIVLCGDHPTMDGNFCENIDSEYVRKTYTAYINSAVQTENSQLRREYSTFDYYPTTLASLGVQIEGNRLGLGTNLFSGRETLIEEYGRDVVITEVQRESKLMNELAATLDMENEQILAREGKIEKAVITAGEFDEQKGCFSVTIKDIHNYTESEFESIALAVWSAEDQRNVIWNETLDQGDGSYYGEVYIANHNNLRGEYTIHVYAIRSDGIREVLGGINVTIE